VLKQEVIPDRQALLQNCRNEYGNQFQAEWLDPLGFDNSFVMVAAGERARQLGILNLSEASAVDPGWKLGVGYEFENRKDGLPALQKAYNLPMAAAPKIMDLGLLYKALADKQVDLVAANATDGLLSTLDVKILLDDKEVFPPYEAAIVVRKSALDEVKGLRAALNKLSGKISSETMRRLNYEVDGKKRPPRAVAAEFLATLK
jgi:osmoprotectant transport system substrate-binding protein